MMLVQTCQSILDNTYEFWSKTYSKVIELIIKDKDVNSFIVNNMDTVSMNKLASTSSFVFDKLMKKFPLIHPDCDNNKCNVYKFWREFYDLASTVPDKTVEDEGVFSVALFWLFSIARCEPKPSATPDLALASARCRLIFSPSWLPPVIDEINKGNLSEYPRNEQVVLTASRSISGNAECWSA